MTTTPRTPKTSISNAAINAKPLAAVVAGQTGINATKPVQNQGTADTNPGSNNPPQGFDGPSPNLSGVNKASADSFAPQSSADKQTSVEQALGLVSQSAALQSLSGRGTSAPTSQSQREKLTDLQGSVRTNQPSGFDQGFDSKPSNLSSNQVTNRNPMAAFQGVSAGDLLTTGVTNNGQATPTPGSGAVGSGMVSGFWDDVREGVYALLKRQPATGTTNTASAEQMRILDDQEKPTNPSPDPAPSASPQPGGGAKIPDPENTGSKGSILTQSLLDQLNAAQAGKPGSQGGSGDTTPVTEGGSDPVVHDGSLVVDRVLQGQNLFGQPGGPALGENVSGGDKGLNGFSRSNGAGAVNPGHEAGNPAGDPRYQQDPLGGGKPAAATPSLNAGDSRDTTHSSVSHSLTAGARNLTLTGTAAINGRGNSLDNLIIGNGAANELRGEAGNDSLNGGAGNDLLDGGSGRDLLTGGTGADRFRFSTTGGFGMAQADHITDFSRSEGDRIEISRSAFGLGSSATISFQVVNSDADLTRVLGTGTLLVQDLRDGSILFNQNGGAGGAGLGGAFAMVTPGLTLQTGDFALIA